MRRWPIAAESARAVSAGRWPCSPPRPLTRPGGSSTPRHLSSAGGAGMRAGAMRSSPFPRPSCALAPNSSDVRPRSARRRRARLFSAHPSWMAQSRSLPSAYRRPKPWSQRDRWWMGPTTHGMHAAAAACALTRQTSRNRIRQPTRSCPRLHAQRFRRRRCRRPWPPWACSPTSGAPCSPWPRPATRSPIARGISRSCARAPTCAAPSPCSRTP